MQYDAERLIKALLGTEQALDRKAAETRAEQQRRASYVVTISRGYGSLGGDVALALASRLGVCHCDREILEAVASRAAVDLGLVAKLDEAVQRSGLKPWKRLFTEGSISEQRFHDHLVSVILNLASKGGVILGRGAHLVLGPERAFRVRIIGSIDNCAKRIAEREQVDLETARRRVGQVDRQRDEYLRERFGVGSGDENVHDLVINSDRYNRAQMVELILYAMRLAGYQISDAMLKPGLQA